MLQIVNMCVHSFLSVTCVHVNYIVKSTTIILLCPGGVQIAESIFHFLVEGSTESCDNAECVHTVREGALNGEKHPIYIHLNQKHKSYNTSLLLEAF